MKSVPPSSRASCSSELYSKTLNNRSSQYHNIITGGPNMYSMAVVPGLLDKAVNNRKKGITEIRDLGSTSAINSNPEY